MSYIKHNMSYTPTYKSYHNMKRRCLNANNPSFTDYGGRGITICSQWLGATGFVQFVKDMGIAPTGKSLDRINVNGNYEPQNCRWATKYEQSINKRKHSTLGLGIRPAVGGYMVRHKHKYFGYFRNLKDARRAYQLAVAANNET